MAAQDPDFIWGNYKPVVPGHVVSPGKKWQRGWKSRAQSYMGHVKSRVRKYSPKKKLKSIGKKIKRSLRRVGLFKQKSPRSKTRSAYVAYMKRSRPLSSTRSVENSLDFPSGTHFNRAEMKILKKYPSIRDFMAAVQKTYNPNNPDAEALLLNKINSKGMTTYFRDHPEFFKE